MVQPIPFRSLVHADWSTTPNRRWFLVGHKTKTGWRVGAPRQVDDSRAFLDNLFNLPQPSLAGFDFPIGVPEVFGRKTALRSFLDALEAFEVGAWEDFYKVALTPDQISLRRPFYPQRASSAARQAHYQLPIIGIYRKLGQDERARANGRSISKIHAR